MTDTVFIDWAINLLEQIETSPEKKAWCKKYSVYCENPGQEKLCDDLHTFTKQAYNKGFVITNYWDVINEWHLDEKDIAASESSWLETKNDLCVLACIAYHFRRDHFSEGSLINKSIADGVLLRLFYRLKQLSA